MKKLIIIFLFICSIIKAQTTYHVSADSAIKTQAQVTALDLLPGDSVLFHRGEVFRGIGVGKMSGDNGSASGYIVYGAYGAGAKPKIYGSVTANTTGDWTEVSSNIWQNSNASFTVDVGNLVFNNDSCGRKETTIGAVDAQGDFWYDFANDRISMYSVGNPATIYGSIECVLKSRGIQCHYNDYIVVENLDIRYCGDNGVSCYDNDHIIVQDCDFSFIGGSDLYNDYTTRYGNGVTFYFNATNCIVRRCTFNDIYDTGVTSQGWENDVTVNNLQFYCNIFKNMEWPFEFVQHGTGTVVDSILFFNNTSINAGGQWGHNQRWTNGMLSTHVMLWGSPNATVTNVMFRNNIFVQDTGITNLPGSGWPCITMFGTSAGQAGVTMDYNLFFMTPNEADNSWTGLYNNNYYRTLANWKNTGFDANSLSGDPLFVGVTNYNLSEGSPAIGAGVGVGLITDYAGNAWAATPSIGAYEYDASPPDPPGLPEITTGTITSTAINALVASSITSDGGGTITARGIVWSTAANPTTSDRKTVYSGAEGQNFVDKIIGLRGGVTYHVRAYVTNESGTAYGSDVSFTTPAHSNGVLNGKIGVVNGKIGIVR